MSKATTVDIPIEGQSIRYTLPLLFSPRFEKVLFNREDIQIYFGGAGSGKSVTLARRTILDMMMGQRNFLIIRKVYGTLKDSFYTELLKAIADLGLSSYFHTTKSPLEIIHKPSGKKILFRGLDDKEKIKSITGEVGAITDILIEEATEITEEDFDMLDTRLRGFADVKKRITILFNPINKEHWIYDRFFSGRFADDSIEESYSIPVSYSMLNDDGQIVQVNAFKTVHIHKSTHKDNKFLLPEDHARYEAFKETNKYYYDVYCLGNWGVLGDLIFTNYKIADLTEVAKRFNKIYFGLDYGYSPDPSALTAVAISGNTIYILKEWRGNRLNAVGVYNEIKDIVGKNTVICDRDEKMKDELSSLGLNIKMVVKYQGGIGSSILHNIQWFQGYKIMIDYRCKNYISEIGSYVRDKDRNGKTIPMPVAGNDHQLDSSYYALNDLIRTIKPMRAL